MRDTGVGRALRARVTGWLRALGADLWHLRVDPLPPSTWLRWLPHAVVCLAAFGVLVGGAGDMTDNGHLGSGLALLVAGAQGGAMVLGLWRPVPAWWLSLGAFLVCALTVRGRLSFDGPETYTWPWTAAGLIGETFVLLLLALRVPTRAATAALALTALLTYVLEGLGGGRYDTTGVLATSLFTVVVIVGTSLRGRREARAQLVAQTTLTAEERTRRTLLEERSRIARELHDVVAHHMSVISIQAQVAPHLVQDPPDELKENLAGIRQNALEALTELRRVLGVLRSEQTGPGDTAGPGGAHAPQPTLDRLDALVENTRAAGREVLTEIDGERRPLPPGVELSAYRIVQEALSNALRHAPGARITVRLTYGPDGLEVEIVNGRPTAPPPPSTGAGHGLLGMRERVAMLGGTMTAHPWHWDGFKVTAFLPDTPPADAPGTDRSTDREGRTP